MKNDLGRAVWRAYAVSLLVAAFVIGAAAQEPGQPKGSEGGGFQKLVGNIHWKKSYGLPPSETDPTKPIDDTCSVFWVGAYEPDGNSYKLVWFDNALKPGRAAAGEYSCSYNITLPANKRFLVRAGMGGTTRMFKYGGSNTFDHNYNNEWIGDTERGPAQYKTNRAVSRGFKPVEMWVTLSMPTQLRFEMMWVPRSNVGDPLLP
jgi:hypothetical protein